MLSKIIKNKVVIDFKQKVKELRIRNNYKNMFDKMTDYHEVVNPDLTDYGILISAVADIENTRAAGQIDELNQPIKNEYVPDLEIAQIQKKIERLLTA